MTKYQRGDILRYTFNDKRESELVLILAMNVSDTGYTRYRLQWVSDGYQNSVPATNVDKNVMIKLIARGQ